MTDFNSQTKAQLIDIVLEQQVQIDNLEANAFDQSVSAAFDGIAKHFEDPKMVFDRNIGERVMGNGTAFAQKFVLGNLCYSLNRSLDWFTEKLTADRKNIDTIRKEVLNDEIGLQKLARAVTFAENRMLEIAMIKDALEAAMEAHRVHTGEVWAPMSAKPKPAGNEARDLQARMNALGVEGSFATPKTDGERKAG